MATATPTFSVQKTLSDIAEAVEKIKNDQMQQFPEAASIGDAVRQGDVYIQLVPEDCAEGLIWIYRKLAPSELAANLQLAPGNTKGSRHVLASTEGLEMWVPVQTDLAVAQHLYAKHGRKVPKATARFWDLDYRDERTEIEEALSLAGPIFKCNKPNVVAHPEHGDWALPAGTYRVIFQRTVDEMERIQRVLD